METMERLSCCLCPPPTKRVPEGTPCSSESSTEARRAQGGHVITKSASAPSEARKSVRPPAQVTAGSFTTPLSSLRPRE